jgi:hypothetical protein
MTKFEKCKRAATISLSTLERVAQESGVGVYFYDTCPGVAQLWNVSSAGNWTRPLGDVYFKGA